MVPQALSSDCVSLGPSTAPGLPSSMAGPLLPFVWKGGTQTRAGLQSRGLANTDQRHRVVPRGKRILLVTLLTFSTYFPTLLENTQNKCYPRGLVAIFSRPKSTRIGQQPKACLPWGRHAHCAERSRQEHRWAGTQPKGSLLFLEGYGEVWPPLEVVLFCEEYEFMISAWEELKWWSSMFACLWFIGLSVIHPLILWMSLDNIHSLKVKMVLIHAW